MIPTITVPTSPIPLLHQKTDGKLWHTVILHGSPPTQIDFFLGNSEEYAKGLTNVINSSLPGGQAFFVKRISLMPALDSLPSDADRLLSNSIFEFSGATRNHYSGPAQIFAKSRGLDSVISFIKKLPKKAQLELLQNMKIPNGLELTEPHQLLSQEFFRARLCLNSSFVLKKEMKITCLLEGTLLRPVY